MKAFVQIHTDGEFYNENMFSAWRAFNWFGYDVVKFKPEQVEEIEVTKETPVFGSVNVTKRVFKRLGVNHINLPSYPKELYKFLGRKIGVAPMGEVRQRVCKGEILFVKPLDCDRKLFDGCLCKNGSDLLLCAKAEDECLVYWSKPVDFISEYRVFVLDGDMLDARKYRGEWRETLNWDTVQEAVEELDGPRAYCLDFGSAHFGGTLLVEATDAWAFGHYGLSFGLFGQMILARWDEIVNTSPLV